MRTAKSYANLGRMYGVLNACAHVAKKHTFTDYQAAADFYRLHQGILKTLVPGQLWEVTVFS